MMKFSPPAPKGTSPDAKPAAANTKRKRPPSMLCIRKEKGGCTVEIQRKGVTYRKHFSVFGYGDFQSALNAAKAWRDQKICELAPIPMTEYLSHKRRNNTSGYPGVFLRKCVRRHKSGKLSEYLVWQAIAPCGAAVAQTRSFSITKYGNDQAFRFAVEARKAFVRQEEGAYLLTGLSPGMKDKITKAMQARRDGGSRAADSRQAA